MIVLAEMFGDASTNNGSVQQHPQVIRRGSRWNSEWYFGN